MSEAKRNFEIQTVAGALSLSLSVDDSKLVTNGEPSTEGTGYQLAVAECHTVLDKIGIPPAKGQACNDPDCNSQLGHRLRILRDNYLATQSVIDALKKIVTSLPKEAQDLVNNSSRNH